MSTEKPEVSAAPENFVPPEMSQEELTRFQGKTVELVEGPRRMEFLSLVLHGIDDSLSLTRFFQTQKAQRHPLLQDGPPISAHDLGKLLENSIVVGSDIVDSLEDFIRLIWYVEEVPWIVQEWGFGPKEMESVAQIKKAFTQVFASRPELFQAVMNDGEQHVDLVLMNAVELKLGRQNEQRSASRDASMTMRLLDVKESELEVLQGKEVLDVGSGLGRFATELRRRGIPALSLDKKSGPEMLQRMRKRVRKQLGFSRAQEENLARESLGPDFLKYHRKGDAADIPKNFGEGRFAQMYACASLLHPSNFARYRRDPVYFWNQMKGILKGLSPEGGEFRSVFNVEFFFTPSMMERLVVPFFTALLAGRFEIEGGYDENGTFDCERLIKNEWAKVGPEGWNPTLRIRRHPVSDIAAAAASFQQFLNRQSSPPVRSSSSNTPTHCRTKKRL